MHKRIPSAAGLGGASSDAAAMLVAANVAWNLRWSFDRLLTLAAKLGSDVPFFLGIVGLGAGAAVCRGRGEILEPYRGLTRCHFVLVRPPQGLSTADVYRRCCVPGSPTQLTAWFTSERISASQLGRLLLNRLQPAASELTPWINRLAGQFTRLQLLGHQMSGSGTCYFGVASNASHARRAVRKLHATGMGRAFHAWNITSPKGWVAAPSRN